MAKKKTEAKTKSVFVLHDGTRYDVTGEDGKFVYCGETQFRKSAMRGELISEEIPQEEPKEETEE